MIMRLKAVPGRGGALTGRAVRQASGACQVREGSGRAAAGPVHLAWGGGQPRAEGRGEGLGRAVDAGGCGCKPSTAWRGARARLMEIIH